MGMLNRPMLSLVSRPTVKVRPLVRLRACGLGSNPSSAAAAWTRWRVSGLSWPVSFRALETVPRLTPARRATSLTVGRALESLPRGWSESSAKMGCFLRTDGVAHFTFRPSWLRWVDKPGDRENPVTETDFLAEAVEAGAAQRRYYVQGLMSGAVKG
jgi:hypothetical protein